MSYVSYADRRKQAEKIKQVATMIFIIGTDCYQVRLEKTGYGDPVVITCPPTMTAGDVHRMNRMVTFLSLEFKDPLDFIPENQD